VRITLPIFNFNAHSHISGTAEARVAKLCVQVEYINFYRVLFLGWQTP